MDKAEKISNSEKSIFTMDKDNGIFNLDKGDKGDRSKTIAHALSVLNDAAQESSEEIKQMLNKDFRRLKDTLKDLKPEVRGAIREIREASADSFVKMKDKVVDSTREAAKTVDRAAHESPWYSVGIAAGVAILFGFMLGRKLSKDQE